MNVNLIFNIEYMKNCHEIILYYEVSSTNKSILHSGVNLTINSTTCQFITTMLIGTHQIEDA